MDTLALELAGVARGRRLFLAESCTGGLISAAITRVPGASAFYVGGVVVYSDELKTRLLGVPEALLRTHGAVSRSVALAMIAEVDRRFGADLACAVTGVAGPGGGTARKPVGRVFVAVRRDDRAWLRRLDLAGAGRKEIQDRTTRVALLALHQLCVGLTPSGFLSADDEDEMESHD
jgi:nicotinamide-nucleotide amidase